jgi:outer membrane protein assembly factor BamB
MILRVRTLALGGLAALALSANAADWPQFRGPNGTGVSTEKIAVQFTSQDQVWKTAIPGVGHSSPIIVGKKIFLQTAAKDGSSRSIVCLDAESGKLLWNKGPTGQVGKIHKKNSLASGTPACDGERVYCTFWDGNAVSIAGFDLDGKELWNTPIGGYVSQHGPGHSPIVHKGLVILNFDQDGSAKLIAYDAKTGKEKWSAKRDPNRACYSTPVLAERGGKTELIVGTTMSIDGYDPGTGKLLWNYPIKWEGGTMPLRAVANPIVSGDIVLLAMGDGGGSRYMVAIKPNEKGTAAKVWDTKKDSPYVPNLIVDGDYIYWVNDLGLAVCAEVKTGKIQWSERVIGRGAVSSSPILVNGNILVIAEDGTAVAFKATAKGLEKVGESKVGEPVMGSPAAANGRLFIRGGEHLFCFGPKVS